jgi:hypothetical protein
MQTFVIVCFKTYLMNLRSFGFYIVCVKTLSVPKWSATWEF